jgi:hypothetical protein
LQHMELDVMATEDGAREEREAGAQHMEKVVT